MRADIRRGVWIRLTTMVQHADHEHPYARDREIPSVVSLK